MNKDIDYLSTILLNAIIAIRNNASDDKSAKLTDYKLTSRDWHQLARDMEDAIEQSNADYELIEQQLVHFIKTDKYWINWANNIV